MTEANCDDEEEVLHHSIGARRPLFLTDVTALRAQARGQIDKGPVTAAYGAALPRVLSVLNDSLTTEIVCVLRYKAHHYGASGSNAESDHGPIPAARRGGAGRRRSAGRADQPARGAPERNPTP